MAEPMTKCLGVDRESWARQGCGALNEEQIMLSFVRFSIINSQRRNCKCSRLFVFEGNEWKLVCLDIYLGAHRHSHSEFANRNIYLTGALYPILQNKHQKTEFQELWPFLRKIGGNFFA
jgi:hypothetical protein